MHVNICENCGKVFLHVRKDRRYCSKKCSSPINAKKERIDLSRSKEYTVWSCGGGVDSAGIAALIYSERLPKPDYAIMTDNGYDAEYTWDYVYNFLKPKLKTVGVNLKIIKSSDYVDTSIVTLKGYVRIPAFKKMDNERTRLRSSCSDLWKVQPAFKWLREQGIKRCVNWIGIAVDEKRRVKKSIRKWIKYKYPLVEMNLSRRDCKRILKQMGWQIPFRSSCIICPLKNDDDWWDLKENAPDDFERACKIERELQRHDVDMFLHRSCTPLTGCPMVGGG